MIDIDGIVKSEASIKADYESAVAELEQTTETEALKEHMLLALKLIMSLNKQLLATNLELDILKNTNKTGGIK